MPVAWPAAIRQLAASLKQSVPATGSLADDSMSIRLDEIAGMVSARTEKEAPGAPQEARDEAIVRAVGYLLQAGIGGDPVEECRCSGSRVYAEQYPLVL